MGKKTYKNGNVIELHHRNEAVAIISKLQKQGKIKRIHNFGPYNEQREGELIDVFIEGNFRFGYILERFMNLSSIGSVSIEQKEYALYYEYIG